MKTIINTNFFSPASGPAWTGVAQRRPPPTAVSGVCRKKNIPSRQFILSHNYANVINQQNKTCYWETFTAHGFQKFFATHSPY